MSERTGLGTVEVSILEALDAVGAQPEHEPVASAKALKVVDDLIGLAPGYAYQVLVDLAQDWLLPVPLVDPLGSSLGNREDPPLPWDLSHCRLSPAGHVALAAERGHLAPLPVGLINGNSHQGGTRPPFSPAAVIDAVRHVLSHPDTSGDKIIGIIGAPDFLTGCTVTGDLAGLAAGLRTDLCLAARIFTTTEAELRSNADPANVPFLRPERNRAVVVLDRLPPYTSLFDVAKEIDDRRTGRLWSSNFPQANGRKHLPVKSLLDLTSYESHVIGCVPEPGVTPEDLERLLAAIGGVTVTIPAALPAPLPQMIRNWISTYRNEDIAASLVAFEQAIKGQP